MDKKHWGIIIGSFVLLSMISHTAHDKKVEEASKESTQQSTTSVTPQIREEEPHFSTCETRRAFGYDYPLYIWWDKEYWWYEDRDHDGVVCE